MWPAIKLTGIPKEVYLLKEVILNKFGSEIWEVVWFLYSGGRVLNLSIWLVLNDLFYILLDIGSN